MHGTHRLPIPGNPATPLRFRYRTIEFGEVDIHVRTLRDRMQFQDVDGVAADLGICDASWPLFGLIWDSGEALARLMSEYDIAGRRVLEVGCGIALASLILNQREEDITATDYHPEAASFLRANTDLNESSAIPFVRTAWQDSDEELGDFDLIIGADLLYERDHAPALASFIDEHARPSCEVIITDPGRGHSARFSREMAGFGYEHSLTSRDEPASAEEAPYAGKHHRYRRTAE